MLRPAVLGWALVAASVAVGATGSSAAADRSFEMRIDCESPPGPGRVRCAAELVPRAGQRLLWADILAIRSSREARPLRSRVRAEIGADGNARAALALVATAQGRFELVLRGRAVICLGKEQGAQCRPMTRESRVELRVGN